ncbi:MAG: hypothetical protein ABI791_07850 [Acidobacteriota bacterium]
MNDKISLDPEGFEVSTNNRQDYVKWRDVESVFAYKSDLFTVDLICMIVEKQDSKVVNMHEDMDGWREFVDVLPNHLHGCRKFDDWFFAVAFPAFETNPIQIYKALHAGND